MDESFTGAELLTSEALATELVRRAKIEEDLLDRLGEAINNRAFDIFLFIWKYGPATRQQLESVFPHGTLCRVLPILEASKVIVVQNFRYRVQK